MSVPPSDPPPVPVSPRGGRGPVTLPTWVNVVLVLTLLVSCGANRDTPSSPSSSEVANEVVNRLQDNADASGGGPVLGTDVQDLCRLLGAVLDGQKQKVDDVIGKDVTTQCAEAARQGATR